MSDDLIAPPVPPKTDLRCFDFMPLDVNRILQSDFNAKASDAEFRAAVTLWCHAWHQVPAGSLPDDDAILAQLAGFGRGRFAQKEWLAVKGMALYGFRKATDGRLYHGVLAEKATGAAKKKENFRERSRKANAARWSMSATYDAGENEDLARRSEADRLEGVREGSNKDPLSIPSGSQVKEKREGEVKGKNTPHAPLRGECITSSGYDDGGYNPDFEKWWACYPRKIGKGAAHKAYCAARRKIGTEDGSERLIKAAMRFAGHVAGLEDRFIPSPAKWLEEDRWEDVLPPKLYPHQIGRNRLGVGG